MIIYLEWLLPVISSDLPKAGGPRQRFCSVLLRMGFTYALLVTKKAVVSYTALPTLPGHVPAVYFCCTFLGVASTGRYPASCPVKPGLSSPGTFRPAGSDRLSCLPRYFSTWSVFSARGNRRLAARSHKQMRPPEYGGLKGQLMIRSACEKISYF